MYLIVPQRTKDLGQTTYPVEHCLMIYSTGPRILVGKVALVANVPVLRKLRMALTMSQTVAVANARHSQSLSTYHRQPSQVIAVPACPIYDRLDQQSLSSRRTCQEVGTMPLG